MAGNNGVLELPPPEVIAPVNKIIYGRRRFDPWLSTPAERISGMLGQFASYWRHPAEHPNFLKAWSAFRGEGIAGVTTMEELVDYYVAFVPGLIIIMNIIHGKDPNSFYRDICRNSFYSRLPELLEAIQITGGNPRIILPLPTIDRSFALPSEVHLKTAEIMAIRKILKGYKGATTLDRRDLQYVADFIRYG